MKVKSWVVRDTKARLAYSPKEIKLIVLKSLLANNLHSWEFKFYWNYLFNKCGFNERLSFFRHGCMWSSTGRSVFKFFKFSRHRCKYFASYGNLVGMRKSSF